MITHKKDKTFLNLIGIAFFAGWLGASVKSLLNEKLPKVVKIKYLNDSEFKLEKIAKGDWIDLRAAKDFELRAGERVDIPLGAAMKLPKGYEAHLLPRSSTCRKMNIWLENQQGIIDNSYCGDDDQWCFRAYAVEDTKISKGDRIAQFRIVKNQPKLIFKEVQTLGYKSRGGFGSTGVK